MSVRDIVPIQHYDGNGSITRFDWDWDMVSDSEIHVLINDEVVNEGFSTEGQSVVFETAPESGQVVTIYRRTPIHMLENYRAFGRFAADKTELSVDRAILIAQERAGDRGVRQAPRGIVGRPNLSITRAEYAIFLNSERGENATINIWGGEEFQGELPPDQQPPIDPEDPPDPPDPVDPPDPAIIWAGDTIHSIRVSSESAGDSYGSTTIVFYMNTETGGDPLYSSARYDRFDTWTFEDWLNVEAQNNEYWMRVEILTDDPDHNLKIYSNTVQQQVDTPFLFERRDIGPVSKLGPMLQLATSGVAPDTAYMVVRVWICADSGGLPDGNWVQRNVILEAIYNV